MSSITEPVTVEFSGGANAPLTVLPPSIINNTVELVWSAVEGGTYRVEASGDLSAWRTNASNVSPVLNRGTNTTTMTASNQVFRVVRTALASYDPE